MNQFQNLLQKNKHVKKSHEVVNLSDKVDEIYIYDYIGESWGEGISSKWIADQISNSEKEEIHIRINSPGGIVFEGRAMATAIRNAKARTVAYIDGLCASAATTIATSCDHVIMNDGSMFMIHNAHSITWGDKNDMLQEAALLEKLDVDIAKDYSAKTGKDLEEIKSMMDAETWFDATEAKENGFVDEVENERKIENAFDLSAFNNAPIQEVPAAVNNTTPEIETESPKPTQPSQAIKQRMVEIRMNQLRS